VHRSINFAHASKDLVHSTLACGDLPDYACQLSVQLRTG
jgi:hypothetical protein